MFFRNLYLFRFDPAAFRLSVDSVLALEQKLADKPLRDVGPLELETQGFVSPHGRSAETLVHAVGDFALITLGAQTRLLPSDVVNEELASRLDALQEKTGRKPGGRERKRLKEEVVADLLPKAFVRESKLNAYLDLAGGWLVVNTGTRRTAENVVTNIREALGSFPCTPMAPEESPRVLLTDWLARGQLPRNMTLGDECELRDPVEAGAIVRCKRQELEADEVREHLKSGKQVYRTALCFNERMTFVLSEDLIIRQLRFLDVVQDDLGDASKESALAELDATFSLQTLELSALLDWIEATFKINSAPALKLDGGDAPKSMREARLNTAFDKLDALARAEGASFMLTDSAGDVLLQGGADGSTEASTKDPLYDEAVQLVRADNNAGISALQRKLTISYNRAARLIEAMESTGIVSAPDHVGKRQVLSLPVKVA